MEVNKISEFEWEVSDGNAKGRVFASEAFIKKIREDESDKSLRQVLNVGRLSGILKNSLAMPDIHQGYGFPIGGVAAFDIETGVISPGGVGYDINCSVRLLKTNLKRKDIEGKEEDIAKVLFDSIPGGVGVKGEIKLSVKELDEILIKGAKWAVEKGYGKEKDLGFIEDEGCLSGANPKLVSQKAKGRGLNQLGTLGAGNHFVDVLEVGEIFNQSVAKVFGLDISDVVIMIHCGSRGLGHQIASDYIKAMEKEYGINEIDRELASAPIKSDLGQEYLSAMKAAANFAYANKQVLSGIIENGLKKVFPEIELKLVYDISHNIAKVEKHGENDVLVVRKGATRSMGPGNELVSEKYREVGQPVLIPGSMGTSSFVMVGTRDAEKISFSSSAHGAGRNLSRTEAHKKMNLDDALKDMKNRGVIVKFGSKKGMVEESPFSYKDINSVVDVVDKVGISNKVARLNPLIVILG